MDDLLKIQAFIDVVENGSFSAAARLQQVSISSIARRVAALEDELGVRLVNRSTRQFSISEAGELYYQRVREAVQRLHFARVEATSFNETMVGVLRVSMRVSCGVLILPQLSRFLEAHPGLSIDLDLTDERRNLLRDNIDVAVWIGQLDDSELIARRLSNGKRLICGSPDYLARRGVPKHPRDLTAHDCLAFKAHNYSGVWRFTKGQEMFDLRTNGPFQSSSGLALMSSAISGLGLVLLQKSTVQKELESGTLKAVLTDFDVSPTEADSTIYAVYSHSRHLAPKARAFIDFLLQCYREVERRPIP